MKFNLKSLILPLSIIGCINTYNINAMEDNAIEDKVDDNNSNHSIAQTQDYNVDKEAMEQDYQDDNEYRDNEDPQELKQLKDEVRKALDYIYNGGSLLSTEYDIDEIITNFSNFLNGEGELTKEYLTEVNNSMYNGKLQRIADNEFTNYDNDIIDYNDDINTNYDYDDNYVANYSDENENQINTNENQINTTELINTNNIENENMELTQDIIGDLSSNLLAYINDCYPDEYFLDLYNKLNTPVNLTDEEKQFLLYCYKNKNVLDELFDSDIKSIVRDIISYLENKTLQINHGSSEYNNVSKQIKILNDILKKEKLKQNMTKEEQKTISDLQDYITNEQSEKANPTESEGELLQMISRSRAFLQSKIRSKEYKLDSNEYETAVARIEECDDLIDSEDITHDITKKQYEYFKNLQDEINRE